MAGSRAPFSAMQRERTKNELIAMTKCFGPMSSFDTCSAIQDQTSLTYRLAQPSYDNLTFPATTHLRKPPPSGTMPPESAHIALHDALLDGPNSKTMLVQHDDGSTRIFNIQPEDLHEAASSGSSPTAKSCGEVITGDIILATLFRSLALCILLPLSL